jgi:hypothetical protein
VQAGHTQRLVGEIDAGHRRASFAHGFGEQAAATTDVEHALAGELALTVDPVQAQRVDVMQRLEIAARIPPAMRKLAEFLEFAPWSALIRPAVSPAARTRHRHAGLVKGCADQTKKPCRSRASGEHERITWCR